MQADLFGSLRPRPADLELLQERYAAAAPGVEEPDPDLVLALEELAELRALMKLVREMRTAQREFFSSRDPGVLKTSKALERQVDKLLESSRG